ncbi:ABC transporter permease subunit [Streptomyces fulvoviolaceus]|uniref:ABC transporter permease subunit n=1 Tax=Streptomyces fulvoviolaceus TaxID=285535 RepID=UPI0021BEEB41|nr:ABC transporter permease subunit [Streptomyces fulvoviolaceus]MCT9077171.1 ABC transporter permease subunit [Streptomyces fulvoviolaceus]
MSAVTGLPRTVLRLHRTALIVWAAFVLAAVAGLVWLNEITADSARASGSDWAWLDYSEPMGWVSTAMYYSFWAVAAWAGSALIGRELESGTARLAWTQGVSPTRWLAAKLALPALVLVLAGAVFVPVYRWAWSANRDLMGDNWDFGDVFAARGPAVVAYGLCALAVGALAAIVLRRSLPALGVAVAVMISLNVYLEQHREEFWPTVTRTSATEIELPNSASQIENGVLVHGQRNTSVDYWSCDGTAAEMKRCTDDLGITGYWSTFHPQSHFWPMNLVETGILLTITALATAAAFWTLRHRTGAARKESTV